MVAAKNRKATLTIAVVTTLTLSLAACLGEPDKQQTRQVTANLIALDSCGAVEDALRQAALNSMNHQLDANRDAYLQSLGSCYGDDGEYDAGAGGGSASSSSSTSSSSGSLPPEEEEEGADEVSGTNNQEEGVDEADFIKNDNQHIYVVNDGALRIIDAWPAEEAHEVAQVALEGEPRKLFVAADRALVYSALPGSGSGDYYGGECTYGYDCDFTGDGTATLISVFDIADRTAPQLRRQIRLSGSYISSRRIGTAVHTVLHDAGISFPGLDYYPPGLDYCLPTGSDLELLEAEREAWWAFERLRQANTAIIQSTLITDWLPSIVETTFDATGTPTATTANLLGSCDGFYSSPLGDGTGFITLLSLGIDADSSLSSSTIVSRAGATYASAEALYISVRQQADLSYGAWYSDMDEIEQLSTVHKFSLGQSVPTASYVGSGLVKGAVLNQFSMSEHQGFLRIATTTGHVPSPDVHSTLTVLAHDGTALEPVGVIDNIAPTEDIRSVRFSGDLGFLVTFKKTDPLFVLDLANPRQPAILAELKIPGFSTYMHMMDENHLLTIGYDADDQGSFAWFTGVMLQIFDVTVPTQPLLLHKEVIGTRGSSSEALNNHLAFNYFPPKDLLSLPMTICEESSGGGSYGDVMTFSGLMVYDTTVAAGFVLRGQVVHPPGADATCGNWWTDASSQVKRSIIMDDYVYSVSLTQIKINHLDDLSTDLISLPIAN